MRLLTATSLVWLPLSVCLAQPPSNCNADVNGLLSEVTSDVIKTLWTITIDGNKNRKCFFRIKLPTASECCQDTSLGS